MIRFITAALLTLASVIAQAQDLIGDLRDEGAGFAQVTPGQPLQFPRDHAPHPDYRIEWWYLTANLSDRDGRPWGLQWTLFRQSLSPEQAGEGWSSNQIWMAHAAITTPDGHYHEQRFSRGGIGQAGVNRIDEDGYFNAWLDDWEWRSDSAGLFPASLRFSVGDRDVIVLLESGSEPVLNGIAGYSQKSPQGQASYYYSQPRIRVRGFASRGLDKTYLTGQGWLDREWSSQALADNQQGWDWFSLHLDGGDKLMVYQLRHDGGEHWLSGNWIDAEGDSRPLDGDEIRLQPERSAKINTGAGETRELPMDWTITLPRQGRSWRVRPLYDQQWMGTSFPYWEGVVLVEDQQGNSAGVGYMELTGYQ
jgi:predicted secreted hydrolase